MLINNHIETAAGTDFRHVYAVCDVIHRGVLEGDPDPPGEGAIWGHLQSRLKDRESISQSINQFISGRNPQSNNSQTQITVTTTCVVLRYIPAWVDIFNLIRWVAAAMM